MPRLFTATSISLVYLKRYPDSIRTRDWRDRMVHIRTDKGLWRADAKGYTSDAKQAWILPMPEALTYIIDLGPEKRAWLRDAGLGTLPQPEPVPSEPGTPVCATELAA